MVQLERNRENVAEHFLRETFNYEVYIPRVREFRVRWRKHVETRPPLFRGYGFAKIERQWHRIWECPGVLKLVRLGKDEPCRIPDEVIAALRKREFNGAIDLPKRRAPRAGDRVRIISGSFEGRNGILAAAGREHLHVLLHLLGAQRQVGVSQDAVEVVAEIQQSQRSKRRAIV